MTDAEKLAPSAVELPEPPPISWEDALARDVEAGFPVEIYKGRWVEREPMAGQLHGLISKRILRILDNFVAEHKLGEVYPDATTYILSGTQEQIVSRRIPDVSFVREENVDRSLAGPMMFAPDLAVEVLSPSENSRITAGKIQDYLTFGTTMVWVIDPAQQQITAYDAENWGTVYRLGETLTGGDLLPGFQLDVTALFEVS